ncbi:MAG: LacI family transcriptional regulator [Burkholderiales bacterium PBB6]|nr:MAG: LacI family transcriptional regulator [Burkholderiales bacterium PBB6]
MPSSQRSRATGRVTLADVAQAAGVSPITASRALRGTRSVDEAMAQRVHDAARQLGYVPDPAARALASARSHHVAVLIPLLSNNLFVDLLEAAQRCLQPAGFQMLIGVTHYQPAEEEALLRSYLAHRPAGLMVTGFDRTPEAHRLIETSGVPCIHLMELGAPDLNEEAPYSVGLSQREAGYALTQHLLAQGRRRVAFVGAQLDPRVLQRLDGYRQALAEAGLHDPTLECLSPLPSSLALGDQLMQQVLQAHPDVDALFFCNDDLAQGGLLAALRLGIPVPQRLSVAGFNDLAGSAQWVPPLTTVRTPRAAIGEQAAQMLLRLMHGEPVPRRQVDVGFELMVRGSS